MYGGMRVISEILYHSDEGLQLSCSRVAEHVQSDDKPNQFPQLSRFAAGMYKPVFATPIFQKSAHFRPKCDMISKRTLK